MIIHANNDRFVKEVLEGNEYAFLYKDLVVVDLGCNIGTFSLWIQKMARIIYAVEMVPEILALFNKTIQENKIENIKTYQFAVAGNDMSRQYNLDVNWGGGSNLIDAAPADNIPSTPCMTLGQFFIKENITSVDILKMDIEGTEREVFLAPDFPKDKINTIIGERHLDPKTGHSSFIVLKDLLQEMGFRYQDFGHFFRAKKI